MLNTGEKGKVRNIRKYTLKNKFYNITITRNCGFENIS